VRRVHRVTPLTGRHQELARPIDAPGPRTPLARLRDPPERRHVPRADLLPDGAAPGGAQRGPGVPARPRRGDLAATAADRAAPPILLVPPRVLALCAALAGLTELVQPGTDIGGGQLVESFAAQRGNDVEPHEHLVVRRRRRCEFGTDDLFQP